MAENTKNKPARPRGPFAHLDLDQREYLAGLDDETIACKGGGPHPFPKLIPNKPLPKGTAVRPVKDGCFQITETCPVCGRKRKKTTAPRGFLGAGTRGHYSGGQEGYIAKGLGLTHADHANELGRRLQETIQTAGKAAKQAES